MIKSTNNVTTIGNEILNAADTVAPHLVIQPPPTKGHPSKFNYLLPMRDHHPSYQPKFQKNSGSKILTTKLYP